MPQEGEWVHPVVSKFEDELAHMAQRGYFWITWKTYYARVNLLLDEYDSPLMCVATVTEVLHAKGVIRCVGPTGDTENFEKPMLDTVFINTPKIAMLMASMPSECHGWKPWQVLHVFVCVCVCMYVSVCVSSAGYFVSLLAVCCVLS